MARNEPSSWLTVPVGSNTAGAAAQRRVTPQYLAHFVLRSEHPEEAESFYGTLLGADKHWESPFIKFLSWDEEHHRVGVFTAFSPVGMKNAPPVAPRVPNSVGVHSMQWSFFNLAELLAAAKRLARRGAQPFKALRDAAGVSLYYHDQDKNVCELRCGPPAAPANAYPAGEEVTVEALEATLSEPLPLRGLPPTLPA